MSPSEYSAPPPELRRELEQRISRTIEADISNRAQAQAPQRSPNVVVAEVLQRLEITRAKPPKLEPHAVGLANLPNYNVRDSQLTERFWVYAPPYEFTAKNKHCDGNPDQCETIADPASGELNVALHIVNHSSDTWAFAGLGHWFVPHTQNLAIVSFNSVLNWSYNYQLQAGWAGETAHSYGETGARVFSWDAQGQDQKEVTDFTQLWTDSVDWWDSHGDSADGHTNSYVRIFFDPSRHYAFCAYVFASCDAGGYPSSQATVDLIGQSPFLVTQEWSYS